MNNLPINKRYKPKEDAELLDFECDFCDKCIFLENCSIRNRIFNFSIDHDEYPEELTYDSDDNPICAAFIKKTKKLDVDSYTC